jgi:hypothetical protein
VAVPLYRNPVVFQSPDILALPRKVYAEEEEKEITQQQRRDIKNSLPSSFA